VAVSQKKTSWFTLLRYPQTWAFFCGKFLTDGVWWFLLFWLPDYLKKQFGLTGEEVMLPTFIVYGVAILGSTFGGSLPLLLINKGMPVYKARMTAMFIIALFPLVLLSTQYFGNKVHFGDHAIVFAVALICIGAAAHQAWSANIFTTVSDMFPKKAVASVIGIGGMAGGIGGVLIQLLAGRLTDFYKSTPQIAYGIMFTICAMAYIIAWSIIRLLTLRAKQIVL
jgi:MFS transporter, ACS family, hexuronate transporter